MLLFVCLVNASPSDSITARVNYGVIFRRTHSFEVVTDYWFHTFSVQLPDVNDPSLHVVHNVSSMCKAQSDANTRTALLLACTRMQPFFNTLQQLSDKSQGHLLRTLQHINEMMPSWATHDRRQRKRGLGSWIGSGLAWTFGLAREKDVDKVNYNIRHIANEVNIALDSWHNIADDMRSIHGVK